MWSSTEVLEPAVWFIRGHDLVEDKFELNLEGVKFPASNPGPSFGHLRSYGKLGTRTNNQHTFLLSLVCFLRFGGVIFGKELTSLSSFQQAILLDQNQCMNL